MGMPKPEATSFETMVSWLESSLDRAADVNPDPGRVDVHRLNRTEYTNAIVVQESDVYEAMDALADLRPSAWLESELHWLGAAPGRSTV